MPFFSERDFSAKPRKIAEVTPAAWKSIAAAIVSRIYDGSFGHSYPEPCPDARGITGTGQELLAHAVKNVFPNLPWPPEPNRVPPGFLALDLVEFCYDKVAMPQPESFHPFFGHEHLTFDVERGRAEFRNTINLIFERQGLAFSLEPNGNVMRLTPMLSHEAFSHSPFATGDPALDDLLAAARRHFLSHDPHVRLAALENLWDAWERLKVLNQDSSARGLFSALLHDASTEPHFYRLLEKEVHALSAIGEGFRVRDCETGKIPISAPVADYLFRRLWAMLSILIHEMERKGAGRQVDAGSLQHA